MLRRFASTWLMEKIGKEIRYERCDGVDVRQVDGEAFFVSPVTSAVHHLNPVATAFWRVLEAPRTLREVADIFADAFPEIPQARLEADFETLYLELERVRAVNTAATTSVAFVDPITWSRA